MSWRFVPKLSQFIQLSEATEKRLTAEKIQQHSACLESEPSKVHILAFIDRQSPI